MLKTFQKLNFLTLQFGVFSQFSLQTILEYTIKRKRVNFTLTIVSLQSK